METKRKRRKPNRRFFYLILLICSIFFTHSFIKEVRQYFILQDSIEKKLATQEILKQEKHDLEIKEQNLNNTEYLLRYARGKYLVTKDDGEQVFKLPEE